MGPQHRRLAVAAMVLACGGAGVAQTGGSGLTPRDNAVVATVLHDLAAYKGEDSPIGGFGPSLPLPVSTQPMRGVVSIPAGVARGLEQERWRALTTAQRQAAVEAARDLERRAPDASGRFELVLPNIEFRDEGQKPPRNDAMFNLSVTLPGYSRSGRVAIVRVSIPWSIHSASATYVLRLGDAKWEVLARAFAIYP